MKGAVIILTITAVVLVGLLLYTRQTTHAQLVVAHAQLVVAHEELAATSHDLATARTALTNVSTQFQNQKAHGAELEQRVQANEAAKTRIEQQLKQTSNSLQSARHAILANENQMAGLDATRRQLVDQLGAVSNQLVSVTQDLTVARKTNTANETQLRVLRAQQTALEMEKASLDRRLNNLDSLRQQIRLLKRELAAKKISEWKQRDTEAAVGGNHGLLLKNGSWTTVPKP